jgi:hypothetical protein
VETDERLCDVLQTGQEVEVDMVNDVLTDLATGKKYSLKPLGDVSLGAGDAGVVGRSALFGACVWGRGPALDNSSSSTVYKQQHLLLFQMRSEGGHGSCALRWATDCALCGALLQAGPVIDAGGIFEFARNSGMIKAAV